jgi:hypothetical protein
MIEIPLGKDRATFARTPKPSLASIGSLPPRGIA